MENHGKLVQLMCIVISNLRTILYIKYILMSDLNLQNQNIVYEITSTSSTLLVITVIDNSLTAMLGRGLYP